MTGNTSKKRSRLIAAALAFALVLPLASTDAAAFRYPASEHADVDYADMVYTGIDTAAIDEFLEAFADDPIGNYPALVELFDEISTQETLAEIESSRNGSDEALSDELERVQNDYMLAADHIYLAISRALSGKRGKALAALMPDGEAEAFLQYEPASDEELAQYAEESALIRDYYLLPRDGDFEDAAAELYLRLVALRRQEAEDAGYDSYADYAYDALYARDFTPAEMRALCATVKKRVAPLLVACEKAIWELSPAWDPMDVPSGEEVLDELEAHLPHVSPELAEAFDYMRAHGLYCLGNGDELLDMGYTVSLPSYRAAFLFNKFSYRMDAFKSTVHEFGHFNAAYHDTTPELYTYSSIDVGEIQSQGLELLFLPCLQDILAADDEEQRTLVELYVLSDMLYSVVDGFLYDEFEQTVYENPGMTVSELHALEARLEKEYGVDEIYEPGVFWPYIGHLFEQPLYYISYAVSALPALDLWLTSLDDRDAAVETYLKLSMADSADWFLDVLKDCGLHNVTSRHAVGRIADGLEEHLAGVVSMPRRGLPAVVVCAVSGGLLLCAAVWFFARKRRVGAQVDAEPI